MRDGQAKQNFRKINIVRDCSFKSNNRGKKKKGLIANELVAQLVQSIRWRCNARGSMFH